MLRHGTCACRSAGCECADCRATESIDRREAREAERSWFGLIKVNRERLMKSAAQDRYVVHIPGLTLPGKGNKRKLEEIR